MIDLASCIFMYLCIMYLTLNCEF